jgi:hypothetical protein
VAILGVFFPRKSLLLWRLQAVFSTGEIFASKKTLAPTSSQKMCSYQGFFCLLFPNFVMWLTKVATIHNLEQRAKIWLQAMCEDK